MTSNTNHKILRVNSIIDNPIPIESLFNLERYSLLAVGRQDNTIEIWNTTTWVQLLKINGTQNINIKKVFMIKKEKNEKGATTFSNLRLFSIGTNGYLIEWSLYRGEPKIYYENPGGCIWDCHLTKDNKSVLLACDDGSVRLIRIKKNEFLLEKQFIKLENDNDVFYTGHSNGTINQWDFKSGQIQQTFNSLMKAKKGKPVENLMIWTLCVVDKKYLVSGNSKGTLSVWDAQFGVLIKDFNEHDADILTTCSNKDTKTIYFTGSNSLVCTIQLVQDEWKLTSKFRGQSHDINSICLLNKDYLLSGGLTTDICIYKLVDSRFVEKYEHKSNTSIKRHISAFEHKSKITFTKNHDNIFVLHRKLEQVNLWLINENNIEKIILLAELNKKHDSHIVSSNISGSGKYIAYSDNTNTVLFTYDFENNDMKKIKTLHNIPSRFIYFSKDEKNLISIDQANWKIHKYNIQKEIFETVPLNGKEEIILACDYDSTNNLCVMSTLNKQFIFVDLNHNNVDVSLPHPEDYITQLKFMNSNKDLFLSVAENNKFYIINSKTKRFSDWTNKNLNNFPKNYLKWYNKVMGIAWDGHSDNFLLYTDYNYINVDLEKEIPNYSIVEKIKSEKLRNADWYKSLREYHKVLFNENYKNMKNTQIEKEIFNKLDEDHLGKQHVEEEKKFNFENDNFKIVSRFSSILFMAYLDDSKDKKTLLVIENDWNKILKEFPEAVAKFNYGY